MPNKEKKDTTELYVTYYSSTSTLKFSIFDYRCYCGRKLDAHDGRVIEFYRKYGVEENEKWNIHETDKYVIEDGLTNAYGEINFVDNNEHLAKVHSYQFKKQIFNNFFNQVYPSTLQDSNFENNSTII